MFLAGASIYVGSYAIFRSFDYRLAFVLMTVPQLLRWSARRRIIPIVTVLALFGTLWLGTNWSGPRRSPGALAKCDLFRRRPRPTRRRVGAVHPVPGLLAELLALAPTLPALRRALVAARTPRAATISATSGRG